MIAAVSHWSFTIPFLAIVAGGVFVGACFWLGARRADRYYARHVSEWETELATRRWARAAAMNGHARRSIARDPADLTFAEVIERFGAAGDSELVDRVYGKGRRCREK